MKPRELHQLFHRSAVLAVIFSAAALSASAVTPDFSITGTAVTVVQGAIANNTSTITVTPVGGFTGSVALTAAITSSPANAVAIPALSFGTTTPVNITGSGAGTAILTISTTAPTVGCLDNTAAVHRVPLWTAGGAALACTLLFGIPARRRSWRKVLGLLFLLVTLTSGTLACSGQKQMVACPALVGAGTTPGTYTVTVTGTSTSTTTTGTVALTVMASPAVDAR